MPTELVPSSGSLIDQPARPYRVLARTYRPQRFSELIGQEALVRTLSNALHSGRVAHAFLLTGIRGVGKTTTARIIARALNCTGAGGPTPEPCGACEPCAAIAEGRHIDVLEMDAATRTGIDDIREIVDSVRYAPSSARYKVYIIDEVHMLSEKAFNGLLKTLEEPPPQTIFIFATTEVRKVPVTVLSRCQRFDLRRVEGELLQRHLEGIAAKEGVQIEPGALALIVRAAEGSVRDGLSLLDQAIALAGAGVGITAAQVQGMLGLADRSRILDLFEHVARGAIKEALGSLSELYALGTEPEAVLQDLLEISHWLTRIKVAPEAARGFDVAEQDVLRGQELAAALSMPVLARTWQMLLKGLEDVRLAPSPLLATEMVLVRLAYAADLPPPSALLRSAPDDADAADPRSAPTQAAPASTTGATTPETPGSPGSFAEAVALFERFGEPMLHGWLYQTAQLVHFEPGRIELRLAGRTPSDLPGRVAAALQRWTGRAWLVSVVGSEQPAAPTLADQAAAARRARIDAAAEDPRIKPVLQQFPGAAVVDVRPAAAR
jgi:DNA polymerase-3 subunit gamma/tau